MSNKQTQQADPDRNEHGRGAEWRKFGFAAAIVMIGGFTTLVFNVLQFLIESHLA